MIVSFEQEYFRELYEEEGKTSKKKALLSASDCQEVHAYD